MKLLWSDKMHGFLTHLKGLLPPLQQLTDQDSLQEINHFTQPPQAFQAFLPQHYTRSSIPPNSQQARINSDHESLQQGSGPSEGCTTTQANTLWITAAVTPLGRFCSYFSPLQFCHFKPHDWAPTWRPADEHYDIEKHRYQEVVLRGTS